MALTLTSLRVVASIREMENGWECLFVIVHCWNMKPVGQHRKSSDTDDEVLLCAALGQALR